jgi:HEAT repeat protein
MSIASQISKWTRPIDVVGLGLAAASTVLYFRHGVIGGWAGDHVGSVLAGLVVCVLVAAGIFVYVVYRKRYFASAAAALFLTFVFACFPGLNVLMYAVAIALPPKSRQSLVRESLLAGSSHVVDGLAKPNRLAVLLVAARDTNIQVRLRATEHLGYLGEAAVDPLLEALEDRDSNVCAAAAKALGRIKDRRATSVLVRALRHASPSVRLSTVDALGEIGDETGAQGLCTALGDENATVRNSASDALARHFAPDAILELLTPILESENTRTRSIAVATLAKLNDVRVVPLLMPCLSDTDPAVRCAAISAFGTFHAAKRSFEGFQDALPLLTGLLQDEDAGVRRKVQELLERIRDPRVREAVRWVRKEPYWEVQDADGKVGLYFADEDLAEDVVAGRVTLDMNARQIDPARARQESDKPMWTRVRYGLARSSPRLRHLFEPVWTCTLWGATFGANAGAVVWLVFACVHAALRGGIESLVLGGPFFERGLMS